MAGEDDAPRFLHLKMPDRSLDASKQSCFMAVSGMKTP